MTATMFEYEAADGVEVLTTWLAEVVDARPERPTNGPIPMVVVRRAGGGDDGLTDTGRYQISAFHHSDAEAAALGRMVHRRLRLLGGRFCGPQPVELDDGIEVYVDDLRTLEAFRPEPHAEPSVYRARAVYEVAIRLMQV